ncbi:MAG: hypothetical protein RR086_05350 [Clostridia bacterium]
MEYTGVNNCNCEAVENDWLEVSYAKRNYIDDTSKKQRHKASKGNIKKVVSYILVFVVALGVLLGMLLSDGEMGKNIFTTAKQAYIANVFSLIPIEEKTTENKLTLPLALKIDDVKGGVMTISGGKVALSLCKGVVEKIGENSVVVLLDDNIRLVYDDLTEILVTLNQKLEYYDCLGKFNQTMRVSLTYNEEIVQNVISSENSFEWEV